MTKRFSLRLLSIVFLTLAVVCLLGSLWQFAGDAMRFRSGALVTKEYTISDLTLENMEPTGDADGTLLTTSNDPQIILAPYDGYATQLCVTLRYSTHPGEVNLYYTHGDEAFTDNQKIWGKARNDGVYVFVLPREKLSSIRLDPSNNIGLTMRIEGFVMNPPRSFFSYFQYSGEDIFHFLLIGAFASCLIACIYEGFIAKKTNRR